jgi:hypothetical protein
VGEARSASGRPALPVDGARRRFRLATPATATAFGVLGLALAAVWGLLTYLTGDPQASRDGSASAFAVACGLVGVLVARRQPRNPEGWLLIGPAVAALAVVDSGLYAVLDYHVHHGGLPLGEAALLVSGTVRVPLIFIFPLVVLLFPDGRLTRRWALVLWAYMALIAVVTVGYVASEAGTLAGRHIQVNVNGAYSGPGGPTGVLAALAAYTVPAFVVVPLFWPAFAARQALSWRRATGERRQQLKWLMGGAVIAVAGLALIAFGPPNDQLDGRIVRDLAFLCLAALPASIGVGILKYHLYDIDRLISRTLSYTLITGVLIGIYAGVVTLTTRVLPFSSPLAVAAATLVVAALFNPLRRRVQRAVDRRFNRARYDAEATVAAFAGRLQDAVDLDAVRDDLAGVVREVLEPARVCVWISRTPGG